MNLIECAKEFAASSYVRELIDNRVADDDYKYMLISRMQSDCKYFLGNGKRSVKCLWSGDVKSQIQDMKALWNSFETKPTWLTLKQIHQYEREMIGAINPNSVFKSMVVNQFKLCLMQIAIKEMNSDYHVVSPYTMGPMA